MCAIAGRVDLSGVGPDAGIAAERLNDAQDHRAPDCRGIWVSPLTGHGRPEPAEALDRPTRPKAIGRAPADHGTTHGALSVSERDQLIEWVLRTVLDEAWRKL